MYIHSGNPVLVIIGLAKIGLLDPLQLQISLISEQSVITALWAGH